MYEEKRTVEAGTGAELRMARQRREPAAELSGKGKNL
jgi:hypothetical protein